MSIAKVHEYCYKASLYFFYNNDNEVCLQLVEEEALPCLCIFLHHMGDSFSYPAPNSYGAFFSVPLILYFSQENLH